MLIQLPQCRSGRPEVFCKEGVLRNFAKFTEKHLHQSLLYFEASGLQLYLKNRHLAQVFSSEFCEISKNSFFVEHLWWLLLSMTSLLNDMLFV